MPPCRACLVGSAKKSARPRQASTFATAFAEHLSADCCGPLRVASCGKARYLLLVVDEYSGWLWVRPMVSTAEVHVRLAEIIEVDLHQRADHHVRYFGSDNGTEFLNSSVDALLRTHDIVRERSCPRSSHQNGKAERNIGVVFNKIRTLLADAKFPQRY